MKKFTLFIALLCSLSAFPTRYLVQGTGNNTWRTAGAGEVNVTLATTLKAWYDGQTMPSGDEVWLAAGTYALDAAITMKADVSLYGSFAGTETTIGQRSKVSGGNPWDFANQTILDGNNANTQGLLTTISDNLTYFDGLKIINFHKEPTGPTTNGAGAYLLTNCTMQNCIVAYNTLVGNSKNGNGCYGAGVSIKGGHLLNSYIHHNDCLKGTGSGGASGGGVNLWGVLATDPMSVIKGCTIENNTAYTSGGLGLMDDWATRHTGGQIEDCLFKSNTATNGAGGGMGGGGWSYSADLTIKNCQFIENVATMSFGGGASITHGSTPVDIEGCSFIGNISGPATNTLGKGGGALFCNAGIFSPIKNCIFRDNKITTTAEGSAVSAIVPITLQNCVIVNNTSEKAGYSTVTFGIKGCKMLNCTLAQNVNSGIGTAVNCSTFPTDVTNCIFWGNANGNICKYDTLTAINNAFDTDESAKAFYGAGSINTLTSGNTFVSPTNFQGAAADATQKTESATANWQLQRNSPAVDAGTDLTDSDVATDILGTARPLGAAYDMGAYEFNPTSGITETNFDFGCFSSNQSIELRGLPIGQMVSVYNITGILVSSQKATTSSVSIVSPKGIYLVQVGNKTNKVIVQ